MTSHTDADEAVQAEDRHGAHNYDPLRIVLCRGEGVWVRDVEDRRYFDTFATVGYAFGVNVYLYAMSH